MLGTGKGTVLKMITQNLLGFLGNLQSTASFEEQEAKKFVVVYGVKNRTDMSEIR